MKRLLIPVFYCAVVAAVVMGLFQVIEWPAAAEGAGCCLTSADCPGKQLCYSGSTACCTGQNCVSVAYCQDPHGD